MDPGDGRVMERCRRERVDGPTRGKVLRDRLSAIPRSRSLSGVSGSRRPRRVWLFGYALFMGSLVAWLVALGYARTYFCAMIVAALGLAVLAVRRGRTWLYSLGVAMGLATLVVAITPADGGFYEGGGWCGSVLHPGQFVESYDAQGDPLNYFDRCDDRAAWHGALVLVGSATSGLLIGNSLVPNGARRRGNATRAPTTVATRASDRE